MIIVLFFSWEIITLAEMCVRIILQKALLVLTHSFPWNKFLGELRWPVVSPVISVLWLSSVPCAQEMGEDKMQVRQGSVGTRSEPVVSVLSIWLLCAVVVSGTVLLLRTWFTQVFSGPKGWCRLSLALPTSELHCPEPWVCIAWALCSYTGRLSK